VAGLLEPRYPLAIADDPAVTAAGGITPTKWNFGIRLNGGVDRQLVECSGSAEAGINLTSTPTVNAVLFPLNVDPASLPIGGFTIAESGGVLTIYARKTDGTLVSQAFG
jgi:hypothetical protein